MDIGSLHRLAHRPHDFIKAWETLFQEKREVALRYINDKDTSYKSLYYLQELINKYNIDDELDLTRNAAFRLLQSSFYKIKKPYKDPGDLFDHHFRIQSACRWMMKDAFESIDERFRLSIDSACIFLLYTNPGVHLEQVVRLIFERRKSRTHTHDLKWAVAEFDSPLLIPAVAQYLLSDDPDTYEYARRWLIFIPGSARHNGQALYDHIMDWWRQNAVYLERTAETNDVTSFPRLYRVDQEAKYHGLPAAMKKSSDIRSAFSALDPDAQAQLAEASAALRSRDHASWRTWLELPVLEQTRSLRGGES